MKTGYVDLISLDNSQPLSILTEKLLELIVILGSLCYNSMLEIWVTLWQMMKEEQHFAWKTKKSR